jgi:cell division protein FtsB
MMPLNLNISQILQAIIIAILIWFSSTLLSIKDTVTVLQANSQRDFGYAADQRAEIKRRLDLLEQEMNTLRYKKQTWSA